MRTELEPQDIEAIAQRTAQRVVELLKPLPSGDSRQDDVIFDKKGLASYMRVSESTINKLVSNKQIPYFKIQPGQSGGVRFYKRDIDKWISRHTIPEINHYTGKSIQAVS